MAAFLSHGGGQGEQGAQGGRGRGDGGHGGQRSGQEGGKQGKRTNGSARVRKQKGERLVRWESSGFNVGCINIAGISLFKLYLLLETHKLDVLCVQETWLM
jgi:hypothetical protein